MKIKKLEALGEGIRFMKQVGLRVTVEPNNLVRDTANYDTGLILGMLWMLILRYEVDLEIDGVSGKEGLLRWCQRCTKGYENVTVKNFGSSWNDGKAFAALIHYHRPDLVSMSKYDELSSVDTLYDIFSIANRELGIPLLIDAEDIADVPRPDDRVIIPYVAFLFKVFASYQKTSAYVKSVSRALNLTGKLSDWIMQYDGQARELKAWITKMSAAFKDAYHGQDLTEIRKKLERFNEYRRGEKPEKREQLTELSGHLQTLNASCRNNQRPEYMPNAGESISELETDWASLQDLEAIFQQSLRDTYILFQRLEAARSNFVNCADQAATFLSGSKQQIAMQNSRLKSKDTNALSVAIVESLLHDNQSMSVQINARLTEVTALEQQLGVLSEGGHGDFESCMERYEELMDNLNALNSENAETQRLLEEELTRQRQMDGMVKDATLQKTRVSSYIKIVQSLVGNGISLEPGCGVAVVQGRLDTLHADYADEKDINLERLQRLKEDADQLVKYGHPEAKGIAKDYQTLSNQLEAIDESANRFNDQLIEDFEREQALESSHKDFISGSNKLDIWLVTVDSLISEDDYSLGKDLTSIERKLDIVAGRYNNNLSDYEMLQSRLKKNVKHLKDGNHSEIKKIEETLNALTEKFSSVQNNLKAYSDHLLEGKSREISLLGALKAFQEKRARVVEWSDRAHKILTLNDQGSPAGLERGCGLMAAERRLDAYRAEYESQQPIIKELANDMQTLSTKLTEGRHAQANAIAEQLANRLAGVSSLSAKAELFITAINKVLERENNLVTMQKLFKASAAKIDSWLCSTRALIAIHSGDNVDNIATTPYGPGHSREEIELLIDNLNEQYTNKVDQIASLLEDLSIKSKVLGDGGHAFAASAAAQSEELVTQSAEMDNLVKAYRNELQNALERELKLLADLKAFKSHERRISKWIDNCTQMVSRHDYGLGVSIREIQAKLDVYNVRYEGRKGNNLEILNGVMQDKAYSLIEGQHALGPDCKERLASLGDRADALDTEARNYLNDLEKALVREQGLETNIKAFRSGLQLIEAWVENIDSMFKDCVEQNTFSPGVSDTYALDDHVGTYKTMYESRVESMESSLGELELLCKRLRSGKHRKANDLEEALKGMKQKMKELNGSAKEHLASLQAARTRESELEDAIKEFREDANTVQHWQETIAHLTSKDAWSNQGCGVTAVEALIDEFTDDFKNQENNIQSRIEFMNKGLDRLVSGKNSSANEFQAILQAIQETQKVQQDLVKQYESNLKNALERESGLQQKLKNFYALHSQVKLWLDSSKSTVENDDFGKGIDFETIEIRSDTFNSEYAVQRPAMEAHMATLETIVDYLVKGKHTEASTATDRLAKLKQYFADVETAAESFKFALDLARTREEGIIKALKMFNTQYGRTSAWCKVCRGIMSVDSSYTPGMGTDLQSVERAIDMFNFKYDSSAVSHRSKLKQMSMLNKRISDAQHHLASEVSSKLEKLTQELESLSTDAVKFREKLELALLREQNLDQKRKDFEIFSGQITAWIKSVSEEMGVTKSGKKRRGSVLIASTNSLEIENIGQKTTGMLLGAGYNAVENKSDLFKSEYFSQVEHFETVAENLSNLATALREGLHKDSTICTEVSTKIRQDFNELKLSAESYSTSLTEALQREATLNKTLQYFHTKAASVEGWIDSVNKLLQKYEESNENNVSKLNMKLHALEANVVLFEAEYYQNCERIETTELNALEEYCTRLSEGYHSKASLSNERLEEIKQRVAGLSDRAASYSKYLKLAISSERDFLAKEKDLAIQINDFKFLCQQTVESVSGPIDGLVFSIKTANDAIETHEKTTIAMMNNIQERFISLQEAESQLKEAKSDAKKSDYGVSMLEAEIQLCSSQIAERRIAFDELLSIEVQKEELRKSFAKIAGEICNHIDEKSSELGNHEGTLEAQLTFIKTLQKDSLEYEEKMNQASEAAKAQDEASVVVNPHSPETIETLRAKWEGLKAAYSKGAEAVSAQILAEKTAGLTSDQIGEANEVFDEFDTDNNGNLNLQEFHDCCTSLGLVLDKEEAAAKHAAMDANSSGRIDREEFLAFYANELTHR